MGQENSKNILTDIPNIVPDTINNLSAELRGKAQTLQEIGQLTHEDFIKYIDELNELSRNYISPTGDQMVFLLKKGSDSTFLWKATVRIACIKFNPDSKMIDSCTILTLRQFIQMFRTFQGHLETMIALENVQQQRGLASSASGNATGEKAAGIDLEKELLDACGSGTDCNNSSAYSSFDTSLVEECCICLDRKSNVILPCLHLFCSSCIEEWNSNKKNCPICMEKLETVDDSWVLSEIPDIPDISNEIQTSLMQISDEKRVFSMED